MKQLLALAVGLLTIIAVGCGQPGVSEANYGTRRIWLPDGSTVVCAVGRSYRAISIDCDWNRDR